MLNTFKAMLQDRRGVSSVMLAVSLPVIVLSVGGGIDMTRAISLRQQVASAIELACKQSALEINYQTSLSTATNRDEENKKFKATVDKITATRLTAADLSTVTAASTIDSKTISITGSTKSQNVFAKVLNFETVPISLTRDCARTAPPPAQGTVLFTESFENNHNVAPNSWTVLKNWNGWTTKDAGIEINGQPQLSGNTIRFGNFFAELDSDCLGASNCSANSTMSRVIQNLAAGTYELRYWYISRVRNPAYAGKVYCGKNDADKNVSDATWEGQTNRINVYFDNKKATDSINDKDIIDICVHTDVWTERKLTIPVSKMGDYRFSFKAAGREDTYGGLIDYIRFCTFPCP